MSTQYYSLKHPFTHVVKFEEQTLILRGPDIAITVTANSPSALYSVFHGLIDETDIVAIRHGIGNGQCLIDVVRPDFQENLSLVSDTLEVTTLKALKEKDDKTDETDS